MQRLALALLLSVGLAPAAMATEFNQIAAAQSRIAFKYQQMGVNMDGSFRQLSGQLKFDPAQPEQGRVVVEVPMAGIDTGSPDNNSEAAGKLWLNSQAFPTARFESTSVKALGDNRYELAGKLTIKGTTRDVLVPASFTAQGNQGAFTGTFALRRGDYKIGEGEWSAFDVVANDIRVNFQLAVKAN